MAQWTVIRMAIARNRDVVELMTVGLHGERTMDAADQLKAGAVARRIRLGGFPHLGQNATRYLSERDFRIDGWAIPVQPVQDGAWRDLVAQRQTYGLHSWVRRGRRRRARQEQGSVRRGKREHS
jgi:hypothetical protein